MGEAAALPSGQTGVRSGMRVLLGLGVFLVLLAGSWLLWMKHVARGMEARMVAEVLDVNAHTLDRTCHVDPCIEGSFGAAIDSWLPTVPEPFRRETDPMPLPSKDLVFSLLRATQ